MNDDTHNIFTEPPDGLGERDFHFETFVPEIGCMEQIEVGRAFAEAADRLLAAAAAQRESWEAAHPILFCYRHALELYLKALMPNTKHGHRLRDLAELLRPHIEVRYPADQVAWLLDRIAEFDRLDPKSTVFRYPDGPLTSYKAGEQPDPELWVDFRRLQRTTARMFQGLERVRLHLLESGLIR
ncbi:MAG: hypothetical protein ROZ37_04850 [Aromatoleum sp.]|jgi:hypothetical protein|uniref:hypothetical protein n=1 Tax=Aromatoleum sp. TaxID=2307007 RepID=UPI0028950A82|nr:hypothetical protein [Aromatoleum sp.]MDT3669646.1 hypothetical protein [Aromatoleum sp.]